MPTHDCMSRRIESSNGFWRMQWQEGRRGNGKLGLQQVRVKPGDRPADAMAAVFWLDEVVAVVFVNDELRFEVKPFQRVPEFVRLRRGAFTVAIADDDERGRLG